MQKTLTPQLTPPNDETEGQEIVEMLEELSVIERMMLRCYVKGFYAHSKMDSDMVGNHASAKPLPDTG